jgi:hypothetical protein
MTEFVLLLDMSSAVANMRRSGGWYSDMAFGSKSSISMLWNANPRKISLCDVLMIERMEFTSPDDSPVTSENVFIELASPSSCFACAVAPNSIGL